MKTIGKTVETEITLKASELAELFWSMNSDEHCEFFEELGGLSTNSTFLSQMIMVHDAAKAAGLKGVIDIMFMIGEACR